MTGFALYPFAALGGQIALCPLPGRGGDLAADLKAISDWGANTVLTLCETPELDRLGLAGLGADVKAMGGQWRHFPIPDFGVPGAAGPVWAEASAALRATLAAGGRVTIHCHGGCGRSGMIAIRLLCDGGSAPEEALRIVRAARPCAVETDAQMIWATGGVIERC